MQDGPPRKRIRVEDETSSEHIMLLPAHASINPSPPHFSQPQLLSSFSYDGDRIQHFDDSSLKYFVQPSKPRGLDLGRGFKEAVWKPEGSEGPDALLATLERLDQSHDELLDSIKVVSWRGLLTKFATAAYESRDSWTMTAQLFDVCLSLHLSVSFCSICAEQCAGLSVLSRREAA